MNDAAQLPRVEGFDERRVRLAGSVDFTALTEAAALLQPLAEPARAWLSGDGASAVLHVATDASSVDDWTATRILEELAAAYRDTLSGVAGAPTQRQSRIRALVEASRAHCEAREAAGGVRYDAEAPTVVIEPALGEALRARAGATGVGVTALCASVVAALVASVHREDAATLVMPVVEAAGDDWNDPEAVRSSLRDLTIAVAPSDSLADLARRAQTGIGALLEGGSAPSDATVREMSARVRFALDPDPLEPHARFGAATGRLELVRRRGPTPSAFDAHWEAGRIVVRWPHSAEVPRSLVSALIDVLPVWLRAAADAPDTPVAALPLATAAQVTSAHQALHESAARAWTHATAIALQVQAQAAATPSATAVIADGSDPMTYAALDAAARRVAAALQARGIGRDGVVALYVERSPSLVVGMLGVLYAGAAYLPVDAEHPVLRMRDVVADAAPVALLTDAGRVAEVRAVVAPALPVLDLQALATDERSAATYALPTIADDDLAYVIYTSGSTGRAKGVELTQLGLRNHVAGTAETLGVTPSDRFLQQTSVSFDAAVWDFFVPLTAGAAIVLAPLGAQRDPAALLDAVRRHAVTVMQLVPSALRETLRRPGFRDCPSVRVLACGGEALHADDVREAMTQRPGMTVVNFYGPTEASNVTTAHVMRAMPATGAPVPIGRPAANVRCYVRDAAGRAVPLGAVGELWIGGAGVARGYRHQPALTAQQFTALPEDPHERVYRSGDLVVQRADGLLEFRGRADGQLKVRGHRVEPAEVEAALREEPGVEDAVVVGQPDGHDGQRLVAFVVGSVDVESLRTALATRLASHLVPSRIERLAALPRLASGKVDRAQLPALQVARPELATPYATPVGDLEAQVAHCFASVLGVQPVGRDDNFFALGGSSLLALRVLDRIATETGLSLSVPTFIAHPTPKAVVARATTPSSAGEAPHPAPTSAADVQRPQPGAPVAIVGFAGRFPGADDVESLWRMVMAGADGTTEFSDAAAQGAARGLGYVNARGVLRDARRFDHAFFGVPRREAEVMDPQQRILLELAWSCIEHAGHAPDRLTGRTGVFAGVGPPTYLTHHLQTRDDLQQQLGELLITLGNDKDYAALRIANHLDLRGPAVSVNTACSTSLVAVAMAVDSLRAGRCRQALAGGATVRAPIDEGYQYEEGAMLSPDARTRTFSAAAQGTSFNDGAAMVLLKRLDDALADGDTVYAVIRGVAVENDGGGKASFTAPSVDGQEATILAAQQDAGVEASSIGYVEAHGTATPLGDPVEVEALTRAFRRSTDAVAFCRLGSVKSNVGHVVTAAGATGLINATLVLSRGMFPPVAHFDAPNPRIAFAGSPFVVSTRAEQWPRGTEPRRAAVSSFGVGGTNAHVILEEAPAAADRDASPAPSGVPHVLRLSARDAATLETMRKRLAAALEADGAPALADVAFTLRAGRSAFAHRAVVAAHDHAAAAQALRDPSALIVGQVPPAAPGVLLMFPGQGAQSVGMGAALYEHDAVFRSAFDRCAAASDAAGLTDLAARVFRGDAASLKDTALAQPAIFAVSYALAECWRARGLRPDALIGHSVGEFVAAAVAGVMDVADAMRLVTLRGRLMAAQPSGMMLSVRAAAADVEPLLTPGLSLAAENGPQLSVVAGPSAEMESFAARLAASGVASRPLETSHAFHSAMMDPVVAPFREAVAGLTLRAPQIAIISTATGTWMTEAQATDPEYWARHLRLPVRFASAVRTALARGSVAFVECGPRMTLSTLVRQHRASDGRLPFALPSLGDASGSERERFARAVAGLWTIGVELEVPAGDGRRVALPTYPFAETRVWVEPSPRVSSASVAHGVASEQLPAAARPSGGAVAGDTGGVLRRVIEEISGLDLASVDPTMPFVHLGLDSLTLTQAAQRIKKVFGVPVTFRELMETHKSLAALTEHLVSMRGATPSGVTPQAADAQGSVAALMPDAAATRSPSAPIRYDVAQAFGAIARIDHRASSLTDRQRARLAAFIRRYVARTARSKTHAAAHRARLADPRVVSGFRPEMKEITYQIVVERSKGSRLWDLDGNEYVDALAGFGMCLFGWQPAFVQEAVRRQLERGYEIGPMHPTAAVVAELVCELSGCERAALVNTGSEAVMGAIRMARTATARGRIVAFAGSYHGTFDEVLVRNGRDGRAVPAVPGVMPTMFGEITILEYGSDAALDAIRSGADDIAAVLVEPVQSRRPEHQPREFLQRLRALTDERDICLIFDEVITGFRTDLGGAQRIFDVRADLVTYGKVIGGGMPIGVIAGNARFMGAIDGGEWRYGDDSAPSADITYLAGTFVRHPLALAAAQASLEHLRDAGPALQETLNARVAAMVARMNGAARARGAPVEVRHFASMWRIAFTEEHPWQMLLFAMMRSRGIHILDGFPCYGTTAHTVEDFAAIADAFEAALDEMQEGDFLPRRASVVAASAAPDVPPTREARLGRDEQGMPAWYVPDPTRPGQFVKYGA